MFNDISLIGLLAIASLLPFVVAAGTCYLKFSIVFVMVRNAMGLQQVPSNMVLNAVALMMAMFVMMPVGRTILDFQQNHPVDFRNRDSVAGFLDNGLDTYRAYLQKYSDAELTAFFESVHQARERTEADDAAGASATDILADAGAASASAVDPVNGRVSIFALLPAYALSEIKSAFRIAFYLYLPFVVIDLVISSILLTLGMMMVSPVVISVPVKLILFVALDGWSVLSQGLILQYMELGSGG